MRRGACSQLSCVPAGTRTEKRIPISGETMRWGARAKAASMQLTYWRSRSPMARKGTSSSSSSAAAVGTPSAVGSAYLLSIRSSAA